MHTTLARLDAEWRDLADSPQATAALREWQRREPALGDGGDLALLLERRRSADAAPAILLALARLAPHEPLAARTLLQALVPGLVRLAISAGYDDPSAIDELMSLAWERIRTYPVTRHGSVAANVLLDTRKQYRRHRQIEAPCSVCLDGSTNSPSTPPADVAALGSEVVSELAAARDEGVVDASALAVIVRTRLGGESLVDIAAEQGTTAARLAQRRWRAERRLRPRLVGLAG